MRTVYLGTSSFAAAVLERLANSDHRPSLVVTRPDRPRGRGRKVTPPPVAETARQLGIDVDQPENVNSEEARARIAEADPDAVAVCAFGALIREPLLSEYEMLNVHPSLLPRWRGAAPVERAIEAGDEETGVTIMKPTAELDAGPIALQRPEPIHPDDNYGTLAPRLATLGGDLLVEALDERPPFSAQPNDGITYADKIDKQDRVLEPDRPAEELERKVRALTPHIGAYIDEPRLTVTKARVADEQGTGLRVVDGRLLYAGLELLEVQPPGKRPMTADAYLRGYGATLP
jgi:methionyl-tRNA formyltransferase